MEMSKGKKYLFFIGGLLIMLCMTLSGYGIGTVTPRILRALDAMDKYTLTNLAASIGMLIFLPICGRLIDTIGRKTMLFIGGAITLIFSFITSMAPTFTIFFIARLLITLGTSCVAAVPSSSLPLVFSKEELPRLYGIQGGILALGTFIGSTIAGAFADNGLTWLAVAYPGILTAVGCLIMIVLMPPVPKKGMPKIDFIGILLIALFVIPLTYASSFGKSLGWASGRILACYIIMIVAIILLVVVEKKLASPLIDMKLFKNPVFSAAIVASLFIVCYQSVIRAYVPLQVQTVLGYSGATSGTVLLPRSLLSMICPTFVGAWIAKNMKDRIWKSVAIAGVLVTVGMLISGFVNSLAGLYIGLGLTGIAESFKAASITPAATGALPREQYGSGMSLISMAGTMGATIGSAIFGIVQGALVNDTNDVAQLAAGNKAIFVAAAITGAIVILTGLKLKPAKEDTPAA